MSIDERLMIPAKKSTFHLLSEEGVFAKRAGCPY